MQETKMKSVAVQLECLTIPSDNQDLERYLWQRTVLDFLFFFLSTSWQRFPSPPCV
jgi:hypothetical protein